MCASLFACAWCHSESARVCGSVHPSLRIRVVVELHVFDGLAYFAKAVLEADSQNIRISSGGIRVANVIGGVGLVSFWQAVMYMAILYLKELLCKYL